MISGQAKPISKLKVYDIISLKDYPDNIKKIFKDNIITLIDEEGKVLVLRFYKHALYRVERILTVYDTITEKIDDELEDLDHRIESMVGFLGITEKESRLLTPDNIEERLIKNTNGITLKILGGNEIRLLARQLIHMIGYSDILHKRLDKTNPKEITS